MITIDKSMFTAEELIQYEALIAKAAVDPEAAEDEMEKEISAVEPKEEEEDNKSPQLEAALKRLESLEKSIQMKEFSEIAKKYAPLGENPEELAKSLYDMKAASEANYNAYIAVLDKSLGIVEKSGIFAEIGKSASSSSVGSTVEAKVEAAAAELRKSNPDMDYTTSIAKAWEDPALMAEYDAEYRR